MSAEDDHSLSLCQGRVQVFAAAQWNLCADLVGRGLEGKADLDEVTEEVSERAAHDGTDLPRVTLVAEGEGQVLDRTFAEAMEKVKSQIGCGRRESEEESARKVPDSKPSCFEGKPHTHGGDSFKKPVHR